MAIQRARRPTKKQLAASAAEAMRHTIPPEQLRAAMRALPRLIHHLERLNHPLVYPDGFIARELLEGALQRSVTLPAGTAKLIVEGAVQMGWLRAERRGMVLGVDVVGPTAKFLEWEKDGCPLQDEPTGTEPRANPVPSEAETDRRPESAAEANSLATVPKTQSSQPVKNRGGVQRKRELERPRPPWAGNELIGSCSHARFAELLGISAKQLYDRMKLLDDPTTKDNSGAVWRQNTGAGDRFMFCIRDPKEQRRLLTEWHKNPRPTAKRRHDT